MLDTLSEIRTEVSRRGFDYLTTTALNDFINASYLLDIAEVEDWPWLETSTSGTSPVSVTDLRTIESVIDSTNEVKLRPLDRRNITDLYPDLTDTGSPEFYYVTTGNAVATYPVGTGTIVVRYYKVPTELSADADEPLVPMRFRDAIVNAAVARCYEDSDNFPASIAAWARFNETLDKMRTSLLNQSHDRPDDFVLLTGEMV